MIQSMTGYGAAQVLEDGVTYAVEIRTLNGRYLKIALKVAERCQFAESRVEKLIRGAINRGSVTFNLKMRTEATADVVPINLAALQGYVDQVCRVELPSNVEASVDLGALAALPGVCQTPMPDEDEQAQRSGVIEQVTAEAIEALLQMRRDEGMALADDLLAICKALRGEVECVEQRAPNVVDEYHERLKSRVALLMEKGELELEADGLMREVAIYAERCDISEEVSRLRCHLDQFEELCRNGGQVGRKLDFIAQEMLREANTIASKSNDKTIARSVVESKVQIDRLKEQAQNVE